ncbi:MAG: HAD-IA family hydrolase [Gammaproteobacteria bacterium]|nr:HAD-IA family hydrolase [Gammaproteobacteria bacterium]
MNANGIDTVLFDLDGTLLDTAGDMAAALNAILARHRRAQLPFEKIRPHVSKGGMALVRLGFGIAEDDEARGRPLYDELLAHYRGHLCADTRLFPGMEELLARIENSARRWGVVTNKPGFLTEPLLCGMRLAERSACVVSGDTLEKRKPWPDPLLHACEVIGADAARAVYIGDDARDIESGRRAGMRTLAAAYGYIAPGDDPREWGADAVVANPEEIWEWLANGKASPAPQ